MVAMAWAFVRLSLAALPDRRRSAQLLVWLTLLLTGKFLVKELAMGQFNLPLALLLLSAVIAAQRGERFSAGAFVGAGVFVKPYALVLVPWLAWTLGWRPFVAFGLVLVAGLLLPAATYGWNGNLTLLHEWYRTVTETTAPNLHDAREHLVRLDVGEVDRARPGGGGSCAGFGGRRRRRGALRDVAAAARGRTELPGRARTSSRWCHCCRRKAGTTCSCSRCPPTCVSWIGGATCRRPGVR